MPSSFPFPPRQGSHVQRVGYNSDGFSGSNYRERNGGETVRGDGYREEYYRGWRGQGEKQPYSGGRVFVPRPPVREHGDRYGGGGQQRGGEYEGHPDRTRDRGYDYPVGRGRREYDGGRMGNQYQGWRGERDVHHQKHGGGGGERRHGVQGAGQRRDGAQVMNGRRNIRNEEQLNSRARRGGRGRGGGSYQPRDGERRQSEWGSGLRLSNIPRGVTGEELKSILQSKVSGKLHIEEFGGGAGIVKFTADWEEVVESVKGLKIGDCVVKKEVIYAKPNADSSEHDMGKEDDKLANSDDDERQPSKKASDESEQVKGQVKIVGPNKKDGGSNGNVEGRVNKDEHEKERGLVGDEVARKNVALGDKSEKNRRGARKYPVEGQGRAGKSHRDRSKVFKLSNIPDAISMKQLKDSLRSNGVKGNLDILYLKGGTATVRILSQDFKSVEDLTEIMLGDCRIEIKPNTGTKHQNIPLDCLLSNPDGPIITVEKKESNSDVVPFRVELPEDVTEVVLKEVVGLDTFVPDYCEIRPGEVAFVYPVGPEILKELDKLKIKEKLVEVPVEEDSKLTIPGTETVASQEDHTNSMVQQDASAGVETDVLMCNDDSKYDDGEEVIAHQKDEVDKPEVLIPVTEAIYASMDVREKAKVIQQARQKSLCDFIAPQKVPQGQLKKKKKKKCKSDKLEDDGLK